MPFKKYNIAQLSKYNTAHPSLKALTPDSTNTLKLYNDNQYDTNYICDFSLVAGKSNLHHKGHDVLFSSGSSWRKKTFK